MSEFMNKRMKNMWPHSVSSNILVVTLQNIQGASVSGRQKKHIGEGGSLALVWILGHYQTSKTIFQKKQTTDKI